jgi:hypothetical protein
MYINSIKEKHFCVSMVTLTRHSVTSYVPCRSRCRWMFTFTVWPFYTRTKSSQYRMQFCSSKVESNVTSEGLSPVQWQTNSIHRSILIFHWRISGVRDWAFSLLWFRWIHTRLILPILLSFFSLPRSPPHVLPPRLVMIASVGVQLTSSCIFSLHKVWVLDSFLWVRMRIHREDDTYWVQIITVNSYSYNFDVRSHLCVIARLFVRCSFARHLQFCLVEFTSVTEI